MRLENHEKLLIWRRRSGKTQLALAAQVGLTARQYLRLEAGPLTRAQASWLLLHGVDLRTVKRPTPGERCHMMRLHAGKTQAKVARELGCCRRWVMLMEKDLAPADDLLWYWEH